MSETHKPGKPTRNPRTEPRESPRDKPGERARDERRPEASPRYGGGPWETADERGERRFGHARNDDAEPSELSASERVNADDESPDAADPELSDAEAAHEIESGGERAGMHRGEKPRKPKR